MRQTTTASNVADRLRPLLEALLGGDFPLALRCWDGSALGPPDAPTTIVLHSPDALRRILFAPAELGLARAYVAGDLDVEGDMFAALEVRDLLAVPHDEVRLELGWRERVRAARTAASLGALGRPPSPPQEEARVRGRRHSKNRDRDAVTHHYDVGNDYYRLFLGDTMTYSCAYFPRSDMTLDQAQEAKYDLVCRKLGLTEGMRLLDVGCGWGGMVMHAARRYGVSAVGVTLSEPQAELASRRVADAGLSDRVEVRVQDYRDVDDGPYDAISSIGMFEHVGLARLSEYFTRLGELLSPLGRFLNHAISRPRGSPPFSRNSFINRYVFPDGELLEVGRVVGAMQDLGLEVRDVESLREHYARTLRTWVANLEANWDAAQRLAGPARARVWRLYMAGSSLAFEAGRISVHQVLAVRPDDAGNSGMPPTRAAFAG